MFYSTRITLHQKGDAMAVEFMTILCDKCKERKGKEVVFDKKTRTYVMVCEDCERTMNNANT